jgi:hypothetical protein
MRMRMQARMMNEQEWEREQNREDWDECELGLSWLKTQSIGSVANP